eukprot:g43950.t1
MDGLLVSLDVLCLPVVVCYVGTDGLHLSVEYLIRLGGRLVYAGLELTIGCMFDQEGKSVVVLLFPGEFHASEDVVVFSCAGWNSLARDTATLEHPFRTIASMLQGPKLLQYPEPSDISGYDGSELLETGICDAGNLHPDKQPF